MTADEARQCARGLLDDLARTEDLTQAIALVGNALLEAERAATMRTLRRWCQRAAQLGCQELVDELRPEIYRLEDERCRRAASQKASMLAASTAPR